MKFHLPDFSEIWPAVLAGIPVALAVIIGAVIVNVLLGRALQLLARRTHFSAREIAPVQRACKWIVTVLALILVVGAFGFNVSGIWGVFSTVFAMVAVGFIAVWSTLSNTLCTLMIMFSRPFSVGDEIEFPGEQVKGRVTDLNFLYTTLEADDGSVLQVPNNLFFQKTIRRRRCTQPVSLAQHLREKRSEPELNPMPAPMAAASPR